MTQIRQQGHVITGNDALVAIMASPARPTERRIETMSRQSDDLRPALMAWLRATDEVAQQAVLDECPGLATIHGLAALDEVIMQSSGENTDALMRRRDMLERCIGSKPDRIEDRLAAMMGMDPTAIHVTPTDPQSGRFTTDGG